MKTIVFSLMLTILLAGPVFSQESNKIVFGPLEGDSAGVLTVHNGEHIEIEMWVHPDGDNPGPIIGLAHALMSEDAIIAERNGTIINPRFDEPNWEQVFLDGPYVHDPQDIFPVPEGCTTEIQCGLCSIYPPCPIIHILPDSVWTYYGSFLMVCNNNVPTGQTYYPFSEGWYPHSGQGTSWAFEAGGVVPQQDFCGLYFEEIIPCNYIPGDCNHNGVPVELADVLVMINSYRGVGVPFFQCDCGLDPLRPDFPATADPNGNCTPNELNDVVTEIGAYRGTSEVSGCPDCPGE
jgi:hypothetical protein